MGPIGRIKRCAVLLERRLDETFAEFGLSRWEFDMLATLRRSGAPYCLAPTTLFSTLMVTSGTMTHRMGKLEAQGWIERLPNPADARSSLVQLTPQGAGADRPRGGGPCGQRTPHPFGPQGGRHSGSGRTAGLAAGIS